MITLAICISIAAFSGIIAVVWYSIWKGRKNAAAWESKFVFLTGSVVADVNVLDLGKLFSAYKTAMDCILKSGVWDIVEFAIATDKLHISVRSTPSWKDQWGRNVAGWADCEKYTFAYIEIGSDFAALAHELIEVLLAKVDHTGWDGVENSWLQDPKLKGIILEYDQRMAL